MTAWPKTANNRTAVCSFSAIWFIMLYKLCGLCSFGLNLAHDMWCGLAAQIWY